LSVTVPMPSKIIVSSTKALADFVLHFSSKTTDQVRVARSLYALSLSGVDVNCNRFRIPLNNVLKGQRADGGWCDTEETAWCAALMRYKYEPEYPIVRSATDWLKSVRRATGGWSRHCRDGARIPTTGLISALLPDIIEPSDIVWLTGEWRRDFEGPVRLSYKAGFVLLAMPEGNADALVEKTVEHLFKDQNEDGGFGPWRNHPIGSDPWSTGVVLWGLSRWISMVDKAVVHKAVSWLERTQLPSGYWPYHYLDDGTSLALIGIVSAMKALASIE